MEISPLFEVHSKYIEPAVGFKSHTGSLVMVTDIQISLVDDTHQKLVHALGFKLFFIEFHPLGGICAQVHPLL